MALPKQVQAQMAEIEALEKTLNAQQGAPAEGDTMLDTEAEVTEQSTFTEVKPEKAKPADTSPTDVADDFKQKYNTLRGKYDAEVPRLHQQVKDLVEQLKSLQTQVAEATKHPTKPKEKVSLVTDADRAEFGEELLDVQRRVAEEVSQDYADRLERQDAVIRALQDKLSQTGNQVGEMSFAQRLNSLVPDFAQIDNDERWVSWLNEYDPILRGPRRIPAKAAFDAGDVEAVAHYVSLFKSTIAQPDAAKATRQSELEKQVAPNRSANSVKTQSVGRDAKIYSAREVEGVWSKIRNLNTRHKYDDAAKLEAEITTAYLEGRVR